MLGKFPNNQKHIEVQIMQRFETELQLYALPLPECQALQSFFPLLKDVSGDLHDLSFLYHTDFRYYFLSTGNSNLQLQSGDTMLLFETALWSVPKRWTIHLLSNDELISFSRCLRHLFTAPDFIPSIDQLPKTIKCYKRIEFGQEVYSVCNDSWYGRHGYILAKWTGDDGNIDTSYQLYPGQIKQIFVYKFIAGNGETYSLPIARIEWYKPHSKKEMFGVGLHLYSRSKVENVTPSSYIPICCIKTKFAQAYGSISIKIPTKVFSLSVHCDLSSFFETSTVPTPAS